MELSGRMTGDVSLAPPDPDGFPPFDAACARPASLAACTDVAQQLDYLCGRVQGSYQRSRDAEGRVVLRLKTAEGDVFSATKPTTAECVAQLIARAGVIT